MRHLLESESNKQVQTNEFGQKVIIWEMVYYNEQVDKIERIFRTETIGLMPETTQDAEEESDMPGQEEIEVVE